MIRKVLTLMTVFALCSTVLADRQLEEGEILQIFEDLTSQPKKTWIPSGTIQAQHQQYKAPRITDANEVDTHIAEEVQAYLDNPDKRELTEELQQMKLKAIPFNVRYKLLNEYTMSSNVIVKIDGARFYWEINVDSRTDSVSPGASLAGNFLTEQFDLNCNQKRVFAWNGDRYTTYFGPVNHAIITDTRGQINGPLTAGLIPWGYGLYSLENLSAVDSTAVETEADGQMEIKLTVSNSDRQETFILDTAKNYALKRYSANLANGSSVLHIYDNYQLVDGNWCPGSVLIERYDTTGQPQRLLAQDIWDIVSISSDEPKPSSFDVAYELDSFIEDFSFGAEPLKYRYSNPQLPPLSRVDTDELMMYRLMIAYAGDKQIQNCATVSLGYIARQLGRDIPLKDVSRILGVEKPGISLLQLQRAAEELGFYSKAIKTDVASLKDFGNYQAILHLPQVHHFVVLGDVDKEYVRLIDLSNNNFYYRWSVDCFDSAWDGTAFLLANQPIATNSKFAKIDGGALREIIGACPSQCNTSCSAGGTSECQAVGGSCGGTTTIYYARKCCGEASSGTCTNVPMVGSKSAPCGDDPNSPGDCIGNGDWKSSTIAACE